MNLFFQKIEVFDVKVYLYILLVQKCLFAYIFQRKMFSTNKMLQMHLMRTFCFAKMHLMRTFCNTKCYKCIFATHQQNVTNAFDAKMHFGCAKMHLMQKCIFATHHIFQRKMFSCAKMHFGVHFTL